MALRLNQALDMARAGEFDVLVTRELDRFARGLAKQLVVEAEFKRLGVEVEYVLAEYDDSPEGKLNKHIRAVIAEFEREKINQRMTRGRRRAVKSGKVLVHGQGKAPYGYRLEDGHLIIYEPEARIIRLMYTWYAVGDEEGNKLTPAAIADRLTEMKVPTWADTRGMVRKKRGRGEWCKATIRKYLSVETYVGCWHYGKNGKEEKNPKSHWLAVEVPAIVERDLWERAQKQRRDNRTMAKRNTQNEYLVARRVRCRCGSNVRARANQWHKYYRCTNAEGALAQRTCDMGYFRADQVDELVWEWLRSLEPEMVRERLRKQQAEQDNTFLQDRLAVIDDLLADNRQQLEKLLDLYLSGDFDKEMLTDRKARLEATIASLEREQADLMATLESQTLTDDQIEEAVGILTMLDLAAADFDFEARRRIVDRLDIQVTLGVESGQQMVYVRCRLGVGALPIGNTDTRIRTWA